MSIPTHVLVSAPEGKMTPIHENDGREPGGGLLYVVAGTVCRVAYSQLIRRAKDRGDLYWCDSRGNPVKTPQEAEAPPNMDTYKIVLDPTKAPVRATEAAKSAQGPHPKDAV